MPAGPPPRLVDYLEEEDDETAVKEDARPKKIRFDVEEDKEEATEAAQEETSAAPGEEEDAEKEARETNQLTTEKMQSKHKPAT